LLSFLILSLLTAYQQQHRHKLENRKVATLVTTAAASNISYQISALRRSVNLLAQGNNALLKKLYFQPENNNLINILNNIVAQQFPRSFAVTLATSNGELLLDNFDGYIGDVCLKDIKNFSLTGQMPPVLVHPNPEGYHIDIMTRIMIDEDTTAILFISFFAEMFSPILLQQQIMGQQYLITNSTSAKLIEITSAGSREHLGTNPRLTDKEQGEILASSPVQGALWNVIGLPQGNTLTLLTSNISSSLLWTIAFIILFSILSAFLAYRRRQQITGMPQSNTDNDSEDARLYRRSQCAQPVLEVLSCVGSKASLHATMHKCLTQLLKLSQSQHGMILEIEGPPDQRHSAYILAFLLADDLLSSSAYLNTQHTSPDKNSIVGHALDHIETTILLKKEITNHTGLPAGYPQVDTLFVKTIEFNGKILGAIVLSNWDAEARAELQDYSAMMDYCAVCLQAHKKCIKPL